MGFDLPSFGKWKPEWSPRMAAAVQTEKNVVPPVVEDKPQPIISDYLSDLLDIKRLPETVDKACIALRKYKFDAIAFRGMSGALIAVPLALKLGKPLIMVRKPGDGSHSAFRVEGAVGAKRYIIADDFVSSGNTANNIVNKLDGECLGVLEARDVGKTENPIDFELTPVPKWVDWMQE